MHHITISYLPLDKKVNNVFFLVVFSFLYLKVENAVEA